MAVVKMLYVMLIASNNDRGVNVDGIRPGECLWKTWLHDAVKLLQMLWKFLVCPVKMHRFRAFTPFSHNFSGECGLTDCHLMFILQLLWKRNFGDTWQMFFQRCDSFSDTKPMLSDRWRKL